MIYFAVTKRHRYTIDQYIVEGKQQLPLVPFEYEDLFARRNVPIGSYIFSDLERLPPAALERLGQVWRAIEQSGHDVRLLNHPLRVKRRFELLRTLHERGINDFDVYRLTEARRPRRYPVFIRQEFEHRGSETDLLHSENAFDAAVKSLVYQGKARDGLLAVEYLDTKGERGLHRCYGAFNVCGTIIPRLMHFSRHWVVKVVDRVGEAELAEEEAFLLGNPYEDEIRAIFDIAGIDFGRLDFTVVDGRIQVFEINTNPILHGRADRRQNENMPEVEPCAERLARALRRIDAPAHRAGPRERPPAAAR